MSEQKMQEAVRKAVQLASIACDWNLDEVEIDGEMVSTHELGEEFSAALALQAEADADDWRPIETVPKDGKPVHVYLVSEMLGSRIVTASFRTNLAIIGGGFSFDSPKATHWRPLLRAPR